MTGPRRGHMLGPIAHALRLLAGLEPVKLVVLGYLSYVVIGWALLSVPLAQAHHVGSLDNLFVAASAVSTTGLATVDPGSSYSAFGEGVLLVLIQLGGMGYMTLGSFIVLARRGTLTEGRAGVTRAAFSLPEGVSPEGILKSVVLFTLACELVGAAALYPTFAGAGADRPLWNAVFHSVSAFCTAGFSLFPNSLESFAGNFWVVAIISALSYLGAVGFLVAHDVWRRLIGASEELTFTTRIILITTFWMSVLGTLLIFVTELAPSDRPPDERLLIAFFQSMTSMTTVGFDTYPIGGFGAAVTTLLTLLMILGASPSGTGGGLKSTTLSALIGLVLSTIRGRKRVWLRGREVPEHRVRAAAATLTLYAALLFLSVFLLSLTERHAPEDLWFEATSALGTVGLTRGITPELSVLGKWVVIGTMFVGRLGPLTFGMALFASGRPPRTVRSDIAV